MEKLRLLLSVEDRNRTSHAYIEALAQSVFDSIPAHAAAFRMVLERLARAGGEIPFHL